MIDERLKQIADHYGLDEQLNMLQEECAELIQAVSKYKRTREYPDFDGYYGFSNLCEEMADVSIMLNQIQYLMDNEKMIADWKSKKIRRQLERIETERKNDDG